MLFRSVLAVEDYRRGIRTDVRTKEESSLLLPKSNVLYFELEDKAWICVRPSGTEPKIKYYVGVKGTDEKDAEEELEELSRALMKI